MYWTIVEQATSLLHAVHERFALARADTVPTGYPANDDAAALAAAVAASLDDQEDLEKAARRSQDGRAGTGSPERPLSAQELALLTDEPLEPPAGPTGLGGGNRQGERNERNRAKLQS